MQALRFLLSRWVLSFVGIAILAALVWLFGPLLPSFEDWVPRLAVVIGLLLVWATSNLSLDLFHRRRERKLESGVAEKTPRRPMTAPERKRRRSGSGCPRPWPC